MTLRPWDCKKTDILILALYVLLLLGLYHSVLASMVKDWMDDPDFSHGFLIAPFAGYLVWKKRRDIQHIDRRGNWAGIAIVLLAALTYYFGIVCSLEYATRISFILWIYGSTIVIFGFSMWRALVFPMFFLLLMVPFPYLLYDQIAFPLKMVASNVAASLLDFVGIPAYREGNIIVLTTMTLDVVDACSGIRSLMSLITIGCIVCYFRNRNKYVQAFVVLSAVPIAILVNSLRVFFTGVFIDLGYIRIAEGFYHTFSGWLVFLGGFFLMVSMSWFGEMIENRCTANTRPS
jgi:exosortase